MMRFVIFILLIISFNAMAQSNDEKLRAIQNLKRISFGSCNSQSAPQPLWSEMAKLKPDLFIWGGDIVYGDWKDTTQLRSAYKKQNENPAYGAFKKSTPILGTWDDHDYGHDNADGTLAYKAESKSILLDFLEEPLNSTRRTREGVFASYEFPSENKIVKIIMLDNRYFKNLDSEAPLLGESQWQWLEKEFKDSTASIHFVTAGLSIFSPRLPYSEEWWHYPKEVNRLLALINKYNPKGLVFLTGDKHFSSIFIRYGQLEFMASGMTHGAPPRTWWYLGRRFPVTYFGLNYGQIDIAWENDTPILKLAIRGTTGRDIHPSNYRWVKNKWLRFW